MTFDELEAGFAYSDAFIDFPEYFSEDCQKTINDVHRKWDSLKNDFCSIENAISGKLFTDEEIKKYALWKAAVCYSETENFSSTLQRQYFEQIVLKFTSYYLALGRGV